MFKASIIKSNSVSIELSGSCSNNRDSMFSTSTSEIVIGLKHIPDLFLYQRTLLIQRCSGPVVITKCSWLLNPSNTMAVHGFIKNFHVFLTWSILI